MREAWHCAEFAQDRSVFIIKSPLDPFKIGTTGSRAGSALAAPCEPPGGQGS